MNALLANILTKDKKTHTSQTVYGNHVQETKPQLVPHHNCHEEVAQNQSTHVILSVRKSAKCRHNDTSQIQQDD